MLRVPAHTVFVGGGRPTETGSRRGAVPRADTLDQLLRACGQRLDAPPRGASLAKVEQSVTDLVSIHAPREGYDRSPERDVSIHAPPAGATQTLKFQKGETMRFQSTRPARGAISRGDPGRHPSPDSSPSV
ncbi:MAG: hypothetical protein ACRD16_05570, partial [Thermoanaerobaculia bacterium]